MRSLASKTPLTMNTTLSKIIVIDSDKSLHEAYRNYFESYLGYDLQAVYASVDEALNNFDELRPHIIFLKLNCRVPAVSKAFNFSEKETLRSKSLC